MDAIVGDGLQGKWELLFGRTNDYYKKNSPLWKKAFKAYNGGEDYLRDVLKKHPSETEDEYADRVQAAYNLNLIKYAVKEFGNYIFSKTPRRQNANQDIVMDFDRQRKTVNEVMWQLFKYHNLCGLVWALVDMPALKGNVVDLSTKKKQKIRPWCKILSPLAVPDWCFDQYGNLEWAIIEEIVVEKDNPTVPPVVLKKRTLYTKTYYQVMKAVIYSEGSNVPSSNIVVEPAQENKLGVVPIIPYSDILFDTDFNTPEIADVLTIYDAILKGESELLTNILKQTYGQLVLPSSAGTPMISRVKRALAKEGYNPNTTKSDPIIQQEVNRALSRNKAIVEEDTEKGTARYIQPTGATTESIISHDDRLIALTMKMTGFLTGVTSTQRESADSKAIDNASFAAQLTRIANKLQEFETNLWRLFNAFDSSISVPEIAYNTDYDLHEFNAVISGLVELGNIDAGDEYKKQYQRTATHVMNSIHKIPDKQFGKIMSDIDAGKSAGTPATFQEQPEFKSEASGSVKDSVAPRNDYKKGTTNNVGKTASIK